MSRREILRIVAPIVFFVLALMFFTYQTFPYERVRDRLVAEVAARGGKLEVDSLEPSWFTGVSAEGVRYLTAASTARLSAWRVGQSAVASTHLHARASVFSILRGGYSGSFTLEVGDGSIEGSIEMTSESIRVEAALEEVSLAELFPIEAIRSEAGVEPPVRYVGGVVGLPLTGTASGTIDLTLSTKAEDTVGSIDLKIERATLGNGVAASPAPPNSNKGLPFERITLGDVAVQITFEKGIGRVRKLSTRGPDVIIGGTGTIRVPLTAAPATTGGIPSVNVVPDLQLTIRVADAYRNRSPRTTTMFMLVDGNPVVSSARKPDGTLAFRVRPGVGGIAFEPSR